MKVIIIIFTSLFFSFCFSQETEISITEKDSLQPIVMDKVPVFPGCENKKSKDNKIKCQNKKMAKFIYKNLNRDLIKEIGLSGVIKITAFFKIDTIGKIVDIKVRAPHDLLAEEIEKIIKLMPQFISPAIKDKKPIYIHYYLPIAFLVE